MIYYKCDCCGYEVSESGIVRNFVSDEKRRNMYQIKEIYKEDTDTLDGLVYCQNCLSRMHTKSMESPKPFGRIMDKLERNINLEEDNDDSYVRFICPKCGGTFKYNRKNNFPSTGITCFCGTKIDTSNGKESVKMTRLFIPEENIYGINDNPKYQCPVCFLIYSRKELYARYRNHKTLVCNCGQRLDNPAYDGDDDEKIT